jgi:hypothetical protein
MYGKMMEKRGSVRLDKKCCSKCAIPTNSTAKGQGRKGEKPI